MTSRCKPVISLTIRLKICFASLWSSLRVRLKRETIGEWEIKGEDFKPHITNREQNHRTTPRQWTPRQDGKTDVPDETQAWLLYQGKQAQEQNHTEMLRGQLLGLPWSRGNNNKDENPWNYNYKESYPHSSYTGLAGLAWMYHLDETRDGVIIAHALVMEAMVSWLAIKLTACHTMILGSSRNKRYNKESISAIKFFLCHLKFVERDVFLCSFCMFFFYYYYFFSGSFVLFFNEMHCHKGESKDKWPVQI